MGSTFSGSKPNEEKTEEKIDDFDDFEAARVEPERSETLEVTEVEVAEVDLEVHEVHEDANVRADSFNWGEEGPEGSEDDVFVPEKLPRKRRSAQVFQANKNEDSEGRPKKTARRSGPPEDAEMAARMQAQRQQQQTENTIQQLPPGEQKMWRLFKAMKDVREEGTNRPLAVNFMRLPSREEMPSYYEVIKKPMDMMRIKAKLDHRQYVTLVDVVSDFMLMLSNACKFNETDSDIYKEAVALQNALLAMWTELDAGSDVPRVQVELRTIFTSMFSKKDEERKSYSDHLIEIVDILKSKGVPAAEWPYTLSVQEVDEDANVRADDFDDFEAARVEPERSETLEVTEVEVAEVDLEVHEVHEDANVRAPKKRVTYTLAENVSMWQYILREVYDEDSDTWRTSKTALKGDLFWEAYVEKSGSSRSNKNVASHFRKSLEKNLYNMPLPCLTKMEMYKGLLIPVTAKAKTSLEREGGVSLILDVRNRLTGWEQIELEDDEDGEE